MSMPYQTRQAPHATRWTSSAKRLSVYLTMIFAIGSTTTIGARTVSAQATCDRCSLPDGSLRLSPAGARKCLADEAAAARVSEALRSSSEATARANAAVGALDESRLVLRREEVARRECDARSTLLEQRVESLSSQRWLFGGAGLVIGLALAILVSSVAD